MTKATIFICAAQLCVKQGDNPFAALESSSVRGFREGVFLLPLFELDHKSRDPPHEESRF